MKCIICGCNYYMACQHPTVGPCSWHAADLCSHCADPELFLEAQRPAINLTRVPLHDSRLLKRALSLVGLKTSIHQHPIDQESFEVNLKQECYQEDLIQKFHDVMDAWFIRFESSGKSYFKVKFKDTRIEKEKSDNLSKT